MPTAKAIASTLREVACMLDKTPDAELVTPRLSFFHFGASSKDQFLNLVKVFPRPLKKGDGYNHTELTLDYHSDALRVYAAIDRSNVCTLVEPAKPARYECVPLLSVEEEEALGKF